MSISQWSTTAIDNADAADGINLTDRAIPRTLQKSLRQLMADVASGAALLAGTSWVFDNSAGEATLKVQGNDDEGLMIRSGQTSDDVIDVLTERPVIQFFTSAAQLALFMGSTTRFYAAGTELMRATGTKIVMQSGSTGFTHRAYTVATLPSATSVAGTEIYVSNEAGGATLAFSDGTNWRRHTDLTIVS